MNKLVAAPPADVPRKHLLSKRYRLFVLCLIFLVLLTVLWLYLHPAWQTHISNYYAVGNGGAEARNTSAQPSSMTANSLTPVVWDDLRSMLNNEILNRYTINTTTSTTTNNSYFLEGEYVRSVVADAGLVASANSDGSIVTLAIGAGDGITVDDDAISVNLLPDGGLEMNGGQVSLLGSCNDGEMLKWNDIASSWGCAIDIDTGAGVPFTIQQSDGAFVVSPANTLEFGPLVSSDDEFIVTDEGGGVARVRTGTAIPLANTVQNITGAWTFSALITADGGINCVDCITLGSETVGNYVASVGAGNGISVSGSGSEGATPSVSVLLHANGGLTFDTGSLTLLTSCGDGQLLKWTAVPGQWGCASDIDTDTTGTPLTVQETDGTPTVTPTTTLQFGPVSSSSDEFVITDQGGGVVRIRTGTVIPLTNATTTITGAWTFNASITASGGVSCTDCIALTSETTGNYLASLTAGDGISISAAGGEADTPSVSVNLASGSGMTFTSGALTMLACSDGQILKRTAGAWACSSAALALPVSVYKQQLAGTDNRTVGSSLTPLLTNGSGTAQSLGLTLGSGNAIGFIATMQVASTLVTGPVDYVVIRDDNHDNDCVTGGGDGTQVGGQVTSFIATLAQSFTTTISFVDTAPSATSWYQVCASTSIALGTASVTNRSLLLNELGQ